LIDVRRREDHYHKSRSWLDARWHFSFGDYHDPDNVHFGPLRVVNHDRIAGGKGFPMHSHEDMEIVTWVIEGSIVHEDSTGTKERVGRNGLQKMSAGNGISHSEYNGSDTEPLQVLQIWVEPDQYGIEPYYQDATFDEDTLREQWIPVASGVRDAPVSLEQEATIMVAFNPSGRVLEYELETNRKGYLVVMDGTSNVNGFNLKGGDALRMTDESVLTVESDESSELLFVDLP